MFNLGQLKPMADFSQFESGQFDSGQSEKANF